VQSFFALPALVIRCELALPLDRPAAQGDGGRILVWVVYGSWAFVLDFARSDIDHAFRPFVQVTWAFGVLFGHDANMGRSAKERQRKISASQ
jgi:hypothetical protein